MNINVSTIKNGILQVNAQDLRVWELITMVPQVSNIWAYVCLALNILLPGTGTMLIACLGDANINKTQLTVGLAQLLTSAYLIGWIISIYWGILILQRSQGDHNELKMLIASAGDSAATTPANQNQNQVVVDGGRMRRVNNPYEDAA